MPAGFELYSHFDKVSIGYEPEELASPRDMELYYKKEDIQKFIEKHNRKL